MHPGGVWRAYQHQLTAAGRQDASNVVMGERVTLGLSVLLLAAELSGVSLDLEYL